MKKLFFILSIFIFYLLPTQADEVVFKAQAPVAVENGSQFRLEYTVNADGRDLRTSEFNGFEVLMGPSVSTSNSMQYINGQMTSETAKTFTFILMPQKEGTFTIPAATVKVSGKQYTSNALTIKVLPVDKSKKNRGDAEGNNSASVSSDDLFMRMSLSKTKVYEQEAILATFKLYSRNQEIGFEGAKFPTFEGFVAQEIEQPENKQWGMENLNGRNYNAVVLKQTLLFPQRSGKITIEPGSLDLVVRIRTQRKMRSFFDDPFDSYQDVKKKVQSPKAIIDVMSLPAGKPDTFMGGVGTFELASSISSNHVKANEAVTIKLQIKGTGNLKLIKDPEIKWPNDFDNYDPKVTLNVKPSNNGLNGTKTIEYLTIPRYAGDFTIPAVEFSYFDLNSKTYKTLKAGPFNLKVDKGTGAANSPAAISNFTNKENVKLLGSDIRYIKTGKMNLSKTGDFYISNTIYLLTYVILAVLFIVLLIVYRKQVSESANIALMKTKKANKVASKRLKLAGKYLKDHKRDEFYDEVLKAVWGYLSDKLIIPLAQLNKDNVEIKLQEYGMSESDINEFIEILNTCEFARYAPSHSDAAMDNLYYTTTKAIEKMESSIKK